MEAKIPLKDQILNKERVTTLAQDIQRVYPGFDGSGFTRVVLDKFPELELKARIAWISESLHKFLPDNYAKAVQILLDSLPPHDDAEPTETDFGIFTYAAYPDFVAKYGCNKENLVLSLKALKEITKRFTAEDSIRYFINAFPKESFAEILKWSKDSDYHVRRLASEGTRPILPWSPRITTPPEDAMPILDNLFADSSRFVTRSVANHLNDVSRTNPDLVLATLHRWKASGKQDSKEMEFITRQALRTLIKTGHPSTFTFLGFSTDPKVSVSGLRIKTNPVVLGNSLEFELIITAQKDEQLIIDYILRFPNKVGSGHNKKVFKLKPATLRKGEVLTLFKKHPMRQMTTRKLYNGTYRLEIQINGKRMAETTFEVRGV